MKRACLLVAFLSIPVLAQTPDLTVGTMIEQAIVGFEPQRFYVSAAAGDFVTIDLEQDGADVIVRVIDPQGRRVDEFDSPNGDKGPEPVRFVASVGGRYEVQVRLFETDAQGGRYRLVLQSVRPATNEERAAFESGWAERSASPIQRSITGIIRALDARWGVYVKCLETGNEVAIDADRLLETMSVIKLPILAELLNQANDKRLSLDQRVTVSARDIQGGTGIIRMLDVGATLTIRDLATLMIVVSDNTATQMILDRIGGRGPVNALMQRYGLQTRLEVDSVREWFAAFQAAESASKFHEDDKMHFGLSSARDMGRFLELATRGQLINQAVSAQIVQTMRGQLYASRLPRDLPLTYRLPHKTGDYPPQLQNDVGIIEAGGKHIVVVVFASHHHGDGLLLDQAIGRIGQLITDYYARP